MYFYWLVIGLVCTWRVAHLIWVEDGPWQVIARLRQRAGAGFWGGLMDCFNCLSLWVAAPFAWLLGDDFRHAALLWLAFSGGAILVERLTTRERGSQASYFEHPDQSGGDDVVLRRRESTSEQSGHGPDTGT